MALEESGNPRQGGNLAREFGRETERETEKKKEDEESNVPFSGRIVTRDLLMGVFE